MKGMQRALSQFHGGLIKLLISYLRAAILAFKDMPPSLPSNYLMQIKVQSMPISKWPT